MASLKNLIKKLDIDLDLDKGKSNKSKARGRRSWHNSPLSGNTVLFFINRNISVIFSYIIYYKKRALGIVSIFVISLLLFLFIAEDNAVAEDTNEIMINTDQSNLEKAKVVEPKVVEPKVVEPKIIEPKVIEPKVIEPKVIEPKGKSKYSGTVDTITNQKYIKKAKLKEGLPYEIAVKLDRAKVKFNKNIKFMSKDKSLQIYFKSISEIRDNKEIYLLLTADAYLIAGDCQQANATYEFYSTLYPKNYKGYLGQAVSHELCGNFRQSILAYEKTKIVAPKSIMTIEINQQIYKLKRKLRDISNYQEGM